jgi:hypothetical protein
MWQELLDGLNPFARVVAEDYSQRMDNALLYGNGPRPDEPGFDGIGALMNSVLAGSGPLGGPPWTHSFRPPEPVPVLDGDGRPVFDQDGEPVLDVPLVPHFTFEPLPSLPPTWPRPETSFGTAVTPTPFLPLVPAEPAETAVFTGVLAYLADGGEQR